MNALRHLLRLEPARDQRSGEAVQVVTRSDGKWDAPTFRAPALPTVHQMHRELPFTANFGPRLKPRT